DQASDAPRGWHTRSALSERHGEDLLPARIRRERACRESRGRLEVGIGDEPGERRRRAIGRGRRREEVALPVRIDRALVEDPTDPFDEVLPQRRPIAAPAGQEAAHPDERDGRPVATYRI